MKLKGRSTLDPPPTKRELTELEFEYVFEIEDVYIFREWCEDFEGTPDQFFSGVLTLREDLKRKRNKGRPRGSYEDHYKTILPEWESLGRPENANEFARQWLMKYEHMTPESIMQWHIDRVRKQLTLQLKRAGLGN